MFGERAGVNVTAYLLVYQVASVEWSSFVIINSLNASTLPPCSRIVFDELTVPQPVKNSSAVNVTKWFITVFAGGLHLSVSRAIISLECPF